jgi:hypothetical protein
MKARNVAARYSGSEPTMLVTAVKPTSPRRWRPSRVNAPASIPSGIETMSTSASEAPASCNDVPMRCWIIRPTGSRVMNDAPKSPRTTRVT